MGDNVEVCVGDLENLQAKIIAIDGYLITVMPKHEDLKVQIHTEHMMECLSKPSNYLHRIP